MSVHRDGHMRVRSSPHCDHALDSAGAAVVALALLLAGCPSPRFEDCAVRCGENGVCPSGLDCGTDGYCYRVLPDGEGPRCGAGATVDASTNDDASDGITFVWNEVTPASGSPDARTAHAMAYDPAREQVILFGGLGETGRLGDTWAWNGIAWIEVTPSESPPPRSSHALAYDPGGERILLFGGTGFNESGVAVQFDDTWAWDGVAWNEVTPASASPPPREFFAMAYDELRARVVLFGGWDGAAYLDDTWEWNGASWSEATTATSPDPRRQHAMTYDATHERVILFGGQGEDGANRSDTWQWDGTTWLEVVPTTPGRRRSHAMTYVPTHGHIVFGGYGSAELDDTWQLTAAGWTEVTPAGGSPHARYSHAMTYDPTRERLVVFGGFGVSSRLGDVWHGQLVGDD